jgi:ABC-type branched-subunit amino acid transport system ATPase component
MSFWNFGEPVTLVRSPTLTKLVAEVMTTLRELNQDGLTILLVEQNANAALAIAHRAFVL